jgi:cell division protein ZapA
MNDGTGVRVMILDREYQVACPDDQKEGLLSAASYLDEKMREMRNRSLNIGTDKLAVVTALNIAYEMLALQPVQSSLEQLRLKVVDLSNSVDSALTGE